MDTVCDSGSDPVSGRCTRASKSEGQQVSELLKYINGLNGQVKKLNKRPQDRPSRTKSAYVRSGLSLFCIILCLKLLLKFSNQINTTEPRMVKPKSEITLVLGFVFILKTIGRFSGYAR